MMQAGKYYVGDLCYVMTDKEWDEFCAITIEGDKCLDGEFVMSDGRRFATYGTMFGDGCYQDQYANEYGVDAGLIGCIRVEDIHPDKLSDVESLGSVFEFKTDFTTEGGRANKGRDWDGVIRIHNVFIETDPDWD